MPRRKKATLQDIVARIVHLYEQEKKSFKEIESILRAEGYDISKSSIHRAYRDYKEFAKRYNEWWDKIEAVVKMTQDKPTTFMLSAVVSTLTQHVMDFVKDINYLEFDDPSDLIRAVKQLTDMAKSLEEYIGEKLRKAVEKIEEEGKKKNIDPEFLKLVKEEIYGI
ncbi:MAG: phage protein Gp27 family protein [Desulfurobacteriaceae bacterium]